jgi:hypothetical protein
MVFDVSWITRAFRDVNRRIDQLTPSIAKSFLPVTETITETVIATVEANYSTTDEMNAKIANPGAISPSSVSASGAVNGNTGRFDGGLFSVAAYSTIISGTRVANWTQNDGTIGTSPSSARFKTNIVDAGLVERAQAILSISLKHYNYLSEIARQADDPDYHVHLEVGMIAEDLHAAGLWEFVIYERDENGAPLLDENGEPLPFGIHYELFGMAVLACAQYMNARINDIEDRLSKAGI